MDTVCGLCGHRNPGGSPCCGGCGATFADPDDAADTLMWRSASPPAPPPPPPADHPPPPAVNRGVYLMIAASVAATAGMALVIAIVLARNPHPPVAPTPGTSAATPAAAPAATPAAGGDRIIDQRVVLHESIGGGERKRYDLPAGTYTVSIRADGDGVDVAWSTPGCEDGTVRELTTVCQLAAATVLTIANPARVGQGATEHVDVYLAPGRDPSLRETVYR